MEACQGRLATIPAIPGGAAPVSASAIYAAPQMPQWPQMPQVGMAPGALGASWAPTQRLGQQSHVHGDMGSNPSPAAAPQQLQLGSQPGGDMPGFAGRPMFAFGGPMGMPLVAPTMPMMPAMPAAPNYAGRPHFDFGGMPLAYAGRPHFDDGGETGGDHGGESGNTGGGGDPGAGGNSMGGGGDPGAGGVGGAVGGGDMGTSSGMSGGYGGFGFGTSVGTGEGISSNAMGSIGATNASASTGVGMGSASDGFSGGINSSAANSASSYGGMNGMGGATSSAEGGDMAAGSVSNPGTGGFSGSVAGGYSANAGLGSNGFGQGIGADGTGFNAGNIGGTADNFGGAPGDPSVGANTFGGLNASPATSSPFGGFTGSLSSPTAFGGYGGTSTTGDQSAFGSFGLNGPNIGGGDLATARDGQAMAGTDNFDGSDPYSGVPGQIGMGVATASGLSPSLYGGGMSDTTAPSNNVTGWSMAPGTSPTQAAAVARDGFGMFGPDIGSLSSTSTPAAYQGPAGLQTPTGITSMVGGLQNDYTGAISSDPSFAGVQAPGPVSPTADLGPALTIHPSFAPGQVVGDQAGLTSQQAYAISHDQMVKSALQNAGIDGTQVGVDGIVGNLQREASLPGVPGAIDWGAIHQNDAGQGLDSVGAYQANRARLGNMLTNVEANAGYSYGALDPNNFSSVQDWADHIKATPALATSELGSMADEIKNDPSYAQALKAITDPNATRAQVAAAMQAYEGSADISGDKAKNLQNALAVAAALKGTGPMSQQANVTSYSSPSYKGGYDVGSGLSGGDQSAPSDGTQTASAATSNPDAEDPNHPGYTNDGTPLGGAPATSPAATDDVPTGHFGDDPADTDQSPSLNPKYANLGFNLGAGLLGGPVGGLLAGANLASGIFGGPTVGSMANSAISNMHPGTSVNPGGSNNGNARNPVAAYANTNGGNSQGGDDTSNTSDNSQAVIHRLLQHIANRKAANAAAAEAAQNARGPIQPITMPTMPPTMPDSALYNPMTDPAVLRALGYAA